jgi:hypothetical protein
MAARCEGNGYWRVPEMKIASVSVPRLFLGDHGFLQMYGSTLTTKEIVGRMQYAVRKSSIGLAAGDERCLHAARQSLQLTGRSNALLYHTDLRLKNGSQVVEFARAMKHLHGWLQERAPLKLQADPIVGRFLRQYAEYDGYDSRYLEKMDIDLSAWSNDTKLISQFRPRLVTFGGDILDFAIVTGRSDIVLQGVEMMRAACDQLGALLFVTLYVASEAIRGSFIPPHLYDGMMVPINSKGHGMLPSQEQLLIRLKQLSKPVLAMHVLASGALSPLEGLNYAYREGGATLTVVGASQHSHIESLISAGQQVLGNAEKG